MNEVSIRSLESCAFQCYPNLHILLCSWEWWIECTFDLSSQIAFTSVASAGYFASIQVELGLITMGGWREIGTQPPVFLFSVVTCWGDSQRTGLGEMPCFKAFQRRALSLGMGCTGNRVSWWLGGVPSDTLMCATLQLCRSSTPHPSSYILCPSLRAPQTEQLAYLERKRNVPGNNFPNISVFPFM